MNYDPKNLPPTAAVTQAWSDFKRIQDSGSRTEGPHGAAIAATTAIGQMYGLCLIRDAADRLEAAARDEQMVIATFNAPPRSAR